jgi:soluble lytic murein transglycosylase-like protein
LRLPTILAAIVLIALAGQARAQQQSMAFEAEAAIDASKPARTPMMSVHETQIAVRKPETAAAADGLKSKEAGKKPAAKPTEKAAASTPRPLVMPGTQAAVPPGMETTGDPKLDELVQQSAQRNGIDPNLIVAVMRQESGFKLRARSYKGAMGLMQLMPATARRFGVVNPYDPAQNIEGGARYLRFLHDTFDGDIKLVLAGYNAGEGAVFKYGNQVPRYRETQNYVRSITARYNSTRAHGSRTAKTIAAAAPTAPQAATFSGGASNRLSNNY